MASIVLTDKYTTTRLDATGPNIVLKSPTVVEVGARVQDVASVERNGSQLVLQLKNGEVLHIDNFFVAPGNVANELVLADSNEGLWWLQYGEPFENAQFTAIGNIQGLLLPDHGEAFLLMAPWAAGLIAVGAAAAASGGDTATRPGINASLDDSGSVVTGTTTPGSNVLIKDNLGNTLGQTTADNNGHFQVTLPQPLQDNGSVNVVVTDPSGNGNQVELVYDDQLAPDALLLDAITATDDVGAIQGLLRSGDTTDDATPTFSGAGAVAGEVVKLYDNGQLIGTATVGTDGTWTLTPTQPLSEGPHQLTFTLTDLGGNESVPSAALAITVDTTAPAAPTINPSNGTVLSGTAEAGSTVNIDLNGDGTVDETVQADTNGNWSYDPTPDLLNGATVKVTATDVAGNTSPQASTTIDTSLIDATAPAAPSVASATDNVDPVQGNLASGSSTNDTTPTLNGSAEAGSTVTIYQDGVAIGTATAADNGTWTFTVPALAEGSYAFTAQATDAANNTSDASAPFNLTVDTTAPDAGTLVSITDITTDSGTAGDFTTNDTSLTINGTLSNAAPGETVQISLDGGTTWLDTTLSGTTWSYVDTRTLSNGTYDYDVRVVDAAGNVGNTDTQTVTVDTTAPGASTVAAITGITTDSGTVGDFTTNDTSLTINGTLSGAAAGETVQISLDGGTTWLNTTAGAGGTWSYTDTRTLSNGTYDYDVRVVDAAGNSGATTDTQTVTVDTTAPGAGTVAAITGITTDSGTVGDFITNDTSLTINGTLSNAAAGDTVQISLDGGTTWLDTTLSGTTWSYADSRTLIDGTYNYDVRVVDAAGNVGNTDTQTVTVDTTAPAAPIINPSNGTVLTGTAEPGSTVNLDFNGTPGTDATVQADANGNWSYNPTPDLDNGTTVTATATDAAGNTSLPASNTTDTGVGDTTAPAAPSVASATDNVDPVQGNLASGSSTNDTTPTLNGSAEAGSTVTIYQDGVAIGTATAADNGTWTFTVPALAEGSYAFTAQATDAANNTSDASAPFNLTVDTTAPDAGTLVSITGITTDSGTAGDFTTNDTSLTINGTLSGAAAGDTVQISLDGGTTWLDTTLSGTTWSYVDTRTLSNGTYDYDVRVVDAAGNVGNTDTQTVTIDTTAPAAPSNANLTVTDDVAPSTGTLASGDSTDDTQPTFTGTGATPGDTIKLYDGATLIGQTTVAANGTWTITPATALANGTHNFTTTATDAAGNTSPASGTFTLTIDNVAPTQTVAITSISEDTGTAGDWSTSDNNPTIAGTLSDPLAAGEKVQVRLDNGAWVDATYDANTNTWFYGVDTLTTGPHTVDVRVVDAAGNIGNTDSQSITIVDNTPPTATMTQQGDLLGLVGADVGGLIDLSEQQYFTVADPDNNITNVTLSVGDGVTLIPPTFEFSSALAQELGLVVISEPGGLLGTSTLTISAADGGVVDVLRMNELLGTVTVSDTLSVGLLSGTSIEVTDSNGATTTTTSTQLLNAGVLGTNTPSAIIEGTTGNETLTGTAGDDRLYGYAGNDTLNAGDGNDLLRGGAGQDTLNGGAGNDILIYDANDTLIDGGTGYDILILDSGTGLLMTLDGNDNVKNIEAIDLRTGDAGRTIDLTEAGVFDATEANSTHTLYVTGDSADTVNLTNANYNGEVLVNGYAFDSYTMGSTTVLIEDPVQVNNTTVV